MSKFKYLLFFFLTSCGLPYLTNTNVNESQNLICKLKTASKHQENLRTTNKTLQLMEKLI